MIKIIYITTHNPLTYRRPVFAKKALPNIQIFNYNTIYKQRLQTLGKLLGWMHKRLINIEKLIYGRSYILSTWFQQYVNKLVLKGCYPDAVITLNNFLASRNLWEKGKIIIDLMDVFDTQNLEEADGIIFWSKAFMDIMTRKLKIKKYVYVPYGIDLKNFDPLKYGNPKWFREKYSLKNKFVLTYSGGIWRKNGVDLQGIDNMLKAFSKVSKKLEKTILILQVFGIDFETLKLIKELGIEDKIIVVGQLPFNAFKRLSLFSATDVFIAPTSRHPTAYYAERMKYFQYMAAAKPTIVEESPGAKNVFGNSAYYVNLGDYDSMVEGILDLYYNEDLRDYLGRKARERIYEVFEWSKLIPVYRNFIYFIINI